MKPIPQFDFHNMIWTGDEHEYPRKYFRTEGSRFDVGRDEYMYRVWIDGSHVEVSGKGCVLVNDLEYMYNREKAANPDSVMVTEPKFFRPMDMVKIKLLDEFWIVIGQHFDKINSQWLYHIVKTDAEDEPLRKEMVKYWYDSKKAQTDYLEVANDSLTLTKRCEWHLSGELKSPEMLFWMFDHVSMPFEEGHWEVIGYGLDESTHRFHYGLGQKGKSIQVYEEYLTLEDRMMHPGPHRKKL